MINKRGMSMDKYIGKLIGNTGNPNDIKIALEDSFSAKRGEFVKIKHKETMDEPETYVLGRIISISRSNILYNSNASSVKKYPSLPFEIKLAPEIIIFSCFLSAPNSP
jgi:hypothetical protein